jgi:hypothetical protein
VFVCLCVSVCVCVCLCLRCQVGIAASKAEQERADAEFARRFCLSAEDLAQPNLPLSPPSLAGDVGDEDEGGAAKPHPVLVKPKKFRDATVAVKNLDPSTTDVQLYSLMLQVGEVQLCRMHSGKKGTSMGEVVFEEEAAASLAVTTLNGVTFNGRIIQVRVRVLSMTVFDL